MYSYLRDNGVCDHCLSTDKQKKFAFYATWPGRIMPLALLSVALLLVLVPSATPANHWANFVRMLVAIPVTFGALMAMVEFIRYSLIGRDLYTFTDDHRQPHCEAAYPVSIEPGHPRDPKTLAAGPVLRLRSRLFARSGIVNVAGELLSRRARAVVIYLPEHDPRIRIESSSVRIDGVTVKNALVLLDSSILQLPELLAEHVVNHRGLVDMLQSKVEEYNALKGELDDTKTRLGDSAADIEDLKTTFEAAVATSEDRKQRLDAIAEDLLTLAARIAHFRDRRCSESHPGAIRTELERILGQHFSHPELYIAATQIAVASNPYANALRRLGVCARVGLEVSDASDKTSLPVDEPTPLERPSVAPERAGEKDAPSAGFWIDPSKLDDHTLNPNEYTPL